MESCSEECLALGANAVFESSTDSACATRNAYGKMANWRMPGVSETELAIGSCPCAQVGDAAVDAIEQLPKEQLERITHMVLKSHITDEGAERVARIVKKSTVLDGLVIISDNITIRAYRAIAAALQKNSSVETLVIANSKTPVKLGEILPLFTYAMAINPNRPPNSYWTLSLPVASAHSVFEEAKKGADAISFMIEGREQKKKKYLAATKTHFGNLRKYRATVAEMQLAHDTLRRQLETQ